MSYYIIIRGPLGSGKSTISKKLASILNAQYFGLDEVLEKNGLDTMPPNAPCISAENFIKANEIVVPEAKGLLTGGKVVIFDACFYHKKVIEHLVLSLPFEHYIFTLKAPVELCITRDSERAKHYGEGAARAVHSLVSRFDYGTVIDANRGFNEIIQDILAFLPTPKKYTILT